MDAYPRAIVHVDGDCFFASCEITRRPELRGKPVMVGGERGIATAMTYEAKARGVTRGMPTHIAKKICPGLVVIQGDYDLYSAYAKRMYSIVGRYSALVQEYSVDECFADITDMRAALGMDYESIARLIKHDLEHDLGITFSVGLAPTKVLAKVASKHSKPSGLVFIPLDAVRSYLSETPIGKIWGIGPATAQKLYRAGITTALDFIDRPYWWIVDHCAKPHKETWHELRGESMFVVHEEQHDAQQSVMATRTFRPPTKDKELLFAHLSKNIEEAAQRARRHDLAGARLFGFLKSQDFQYRRFEIDLLEHTNLAPYLLGAVRPAFEKAFRPGIMYRATGVILSRVAEHPPQQPDIFGASVHSNKFDRVYQSVDRIRAAFGGKSIFLGSSMPALSKHKTEEAHLGLPFLGEVT